MSTASVVDVLPEPIVQTVQGLSLWALEVLLRYSHLLLLVAGFCFFTSGGGKGKNKTKKKKHKKPKQGGEANQPEGSHTNGDGQQQLQQEQQQQDDSDGSSPSPTPRAEDGKLAALPPRILAYIGLFLTPGEALTVAAASKGWATHLPVKEVRCRWPYWDEKQDHRPLIRLLARQCELERVVLRDLLSVIGFVEAVVAGYCSTVVELEVNEQHQCDQPRAQAEQLPMQCHHHHHHHRRRHHNRIHASGPELLDEAQEREWEEDHQHRGVGAWTEDESSVDNTWVLLLCSRLAVDLLPKLSCLRLKARMGVPGLMALAYALEARNGEACMPLSQLHLGRWLGQQLPACVASSLHCLLQSDACVALQDLEINQALGPAELEAVLDYLCRPLEDEAPPSGDNISSTSTSLLRRLVLTVCDGVSADGLLEALAGTSTYQHQLEVLEVHGCQLTTESADHLSRWAGMSSLRELSLVRACGLGNCVEELVAALGGYQSLTTLRLGSAHVPRCGSEQEGDNEDSDSPNATAVVAALVEAIRRGGFSRLEHLQLGYVLGGDGTLLDLVSALQGSCLCRTLTVEMAACSISPSELRSLAVALAKREGGVVGLRYRTVRLHVTGGGRGVGCRRGPSLADFLCALQLDHGREDLGGRPSVSVWPPHHRQLAPALIKQLPREAIREAASACCWHMTVVW